MKRLWKGWVEMMDQRETGESLALCRIMAGIGLMSSVLVVLPSRSIQRLWVDERWGGYRSLENLPWLAELFGGATPALALSLAGISLICGLLLTLGWWARGSALLGLLAFNTIIRLNPHDGSAYDSVLTNQLFLLIWAQSGATWSLRSRLAEGRWPSDQKVQAWPRYVMVIQLVLLYFTTGVQKVSSHWVPGGDLAALHYILQDPFWIRWDLSLWLGDFWHLTQMATAGSWWFEVASPLLLLVFWYRYTRDRPGRVRALFNRMDFRTCFAAFGVAFHLGILLFMRVGPFTWLILSFYPALFHPVEIRAALSRFGLKALWSGGILSNARGHIPRQDP